MEPQFFSQPDGRLIRFHCRPMRGKPELQAVLQIQDACCCRQPLASLFFPVRFHIDLVVLAVYTAGETRADDLVALHDAIPETLFQKIVDRVPEFRNRVRQLLVPISFDHRSVNFPRAIPAWQWLEAALRDQKAIGMKREVAFKIRLVVSV